MIFLVFHVFNFEIRYVHFFVFDDMGHLISFEIILSKFFILMIFSLDIKKKK